MAMFRLDYLSCLLAVVATVLVGRKMWTGLVVSGLNSFIVCVMCCRAEPVARARNNGVLSITKKRLTRQDRQAGIENGVPVPSFCPINGVLQQLSSSRPADRLDAES